MEVNTFFATYSGIMSFWIVAAFLYQRSCPLYLLTF